MFQSFPVVHNFIRVLYFVSNILSLIIDCIFQNLHRFRSTKAKRFTLTEMPHEMPHELQTK